MSQSDASNIPANLEKAHVEEAYARWAPIYDFVFAAVMKPGRLAAAAAVDRPGGLVLDVGVGTGLELPMFNRQTRLIGVDLSAPMLERAKMRVKAEGLTNVEDLLVMDAMALEFPDNHFDAVVAPFVLTVVPDPEATLAELARVVKPGGEIVLVNHVGAESGFIAFVEDFLAKHSHKLGWRPQFPWSILGNWISARSDIQLIERRAIAPLGLFTLARMLKTGA